MEKGVGAENVEAWSSCRGMNHWQVRPFCLWRENKSRLWYNGSFF